MLYEWDVYISRIAGSTVNLKHSKFTKYFNPHLAGSGILLSKQLEEATLKVLLEKKLKIWKKP